MPQIIVSDVAKSYWIAAREPGLGGALRGIFLRRRREITALDNVSLSLDEGELVGMIGPNGAGKSTLIKILCGILEPTSGDIVIDGRVPWRERVAHVARIGVVFGQRTQLWWDLPVLDSFELLRDIYRVPESQFRITLKRLVDMLNIGSVLDQPVRQLSLGQRMRCDIAAALLHAPKILFLDEPTIGLDAVSKLAVRDFVKTLNRDENVTVILATHDMHDIEALAERVIIIAHGRVLRDGPVDGMRRETAGERRLKIDFADDLPGTLSLPYGVVVLERNGSRLELGFDPRQTPAHVLIGNLAALRPIQDLRLEEPTIEELIARFYTSHGAADA